MVNFFYSERQEQKMSHNHDTADVSSPTGKFLQQEKLQVTKQLHDTAWSWAHENTEAKTCTSRTAGRL